MSTLQPGDVLGRYEIKKALARGGMAEVWLATLRSIDGFSKKLVLKTILPHLAENPEFVKMFVNEALLAARINHPHIVQILDLGRIEGRYFIAMEHVPGLTLRQISRKCKASGALIPPWFVLRAVVAVCEGLQHAHDLVDDEGQHLGLVHRDVSPENIMISFAGLPKVLDFGVAKASTDATSTRVGTLKGKYAYISPEQVNGDRADRRSDVYSLGVVLYELLTGWRPFRADNDFLLLRKVVEGNAKPAKERAPWMPDSLNEVIMGALATDPAARIASTDELGTKLLGVLKKARDSHGQRELGEHLRALRDGTVAIDPSAGLPPDAPETPSGADPQAEQELSFASVLSISYPDMAPDESDERPAAELAQGAPLKSAMASADHRPQESPHQRASNGLDGNDQRSQGEALVEQLRSQKGRGRHIHISGQISSGALHQREEDWAWREIASLCDTEAAALEARARADVAARQAAAKEISQSTRLRELIDEISKSTPMPGAPALVAEDEVEEPVSPAKKRSLREPQSGHAEPEKPPSTRTAGQSQEAGVTDQLDQASISEEVARLVEQGFDALREGKLYDARYAWERVVELDPDNRSYQLNLRKLETRIAKQEEGS